MNSTKKLTRSTSDKVISGVCGGLGQYLDVDVTIVRLIFVFLTLMGGGGLILYLIMWALIPLETSKSKTAAQTFKSNTEEMKSSAKEWIEKAGIKTNQDRNPLGLILVLVGGYFLLTNLGWFEWLDIGRLWPIILIVLGIIVLKRK
jgi:phage shock protein C